MSFGRTSRAGPPSRRSRSARCPGGRRRRGPRTAGREKLSGHAVGQVAAVGEVHAQDPVAGLEDAEVGRHVRLGARVGLDVDVLGAREQGERALLGEALGDVDELAAAVVALARQALGVLVRQPRALGLHDRGRDVVLAGDELDLVVLAAALALHRLPELGVDLGELTARLGEPTASRDRLLSAELGSMAAPDVLVLPVPWLRVRPRRRAIFPRTTRSRRSPQSAARRTSGEARVARARVGRIGLVGSRAHGAIAPGAQDASARRRCSRRPSMPARQRAGPPSRMRSMASPSCAAISAASTASGCPRDVGRGRRAAARAAAASARGAAWSGTRRPIVGRARRSAPPGRATSGRCGTISVSPPGQNAAAEGRGRRRHRRRSSAACAASASSSMIPLSGGRRFTSNRRSMPPRRRPGRRAMP